MESDHDLGALRAALQEISRLASWSEARLTTIRPAVSRWSPAQQIDHVLRTLMLNLRAVRALQHGEDDRIERGASATEAGRALLESGRIVRGQAETPAAAVPEEQPVVAGFEKRIRSLTSRLAGFDVSGLEAHPEQTLPHPALGPLNAAQWLRFARVHTEHHLAIIRDIDADGVGEG